MGEKITIDLIEYNALKLAEKKLSALEAAGVDNWEWYGDAMATVFGDEEDEE